jgi:excisionase family DNA binding protein
MTRLEAAVAELVAALREELAPTVEPQPDRLLSVSEAAHALGISRTTTYGEIGAGKLRSLVVGRRRLVSATALAEYIASAESNGTTDLGPSAPLAARPVATPPRGRRASARSTAPRSAGIGLGDRAPLSTA